MTHGSSGLIRLGAAAPGLERMEAHFQGRPFAPHRHDTYAIGLTLHGVQSFRFRGQRWHCLPGQCHILHPDELHDGAAGTDAGFGYRIVHLDPALVRQALGGQALPFVAEPVQDLERLPGAPDASLWDMGEPLDELQCVELVDALAGLLHGAAGGRPARVRLALPALQRVRDCIAAHPARPQPMASLERLSGLDRWTLARQFRAAYGTSPSRFRTLRQLDLARAALQRGLRPADAALAAGFADQSHLTRQFKRAYGLTPARWAAALA
jgi:AraC-like DNA-binding protein